MVLKIPEERKSVLLSQLKKGLPEGELKEQLRKEGYSQEAIDDCFTPVKYDMRSWFLFFGIILTLIGIYILLAYNSFLLVILGSLLLAEYYSIKKKTPNRS